MRRLGTLFAGLSVVAAFASTGSAEVVQKKVAAVGKVPTVAVSRTALKPLHPEITELSSKVTKVRLPGQLASVAVPNDVPVTPVPAGYGRYCSLSYSGGGWAFVTLTPSDSDPCADALKSSPGGTITRAGLWSIAGDNNVLVRCGTDLRIYKARGATATAQAFDEANGKKNCVFVVSPTALPVFGRPYGKTTNAQTNPSADVGHATCFDYAQFGKSLDVTQFGQPGGSSSMVDRFGRAHTSGQNGHDAHDWPMPKGKPLLAVADGIVRDVRWRDVSDFGCADTQQSEIYIEHQIGTGQYAERFVSYYAHLDTMSVVKGATVTRGQAIGTAGTRGCSSGPHLHLGVTRLTNLTGKRFHGFKTVPDAHGDNGFGTRIDPYGWNAPQHVDPWAWMYLGEFTDPWDTYVDPGAFSINLWMAGQAPPADNW